MARSASNPKMKNWRRRRRRSRREEEEVRDNAIR